MRTQEDLKSIQQRLVNAVKSKNMPEVMQLIADTGINLNTEVCGTTACHYIGRVADDSLRVLLQANSELEFDIDQYSHGAARGGHKAYTEELRTQHGADVDLIAYGEAWGGHFAYAEELRTQHGAAVNWIAFGAAFGGHRTYAEELRTQYGAYVDHIAEGAGRGGHKAYAEELRTQHGAYVHTIARAAASGGHRAYAEELRTQHGADIEEIITGASGAYETFLQQIIDQSELTATAGSIGPSPSNNVNGLFSTVHNHTSIADYSGTIVISLPEDPALLDQFEEEVGESYLCPITRCVFTQPVMASDGETYEYCAIKQHMETQLQQGAQVKSPRTNQPLENHNLIPNNDKARTLRDKLDAFLSKQKQRTAEDQYSEPDNNNAKKSGPL